LGSPHKILTPVLHVGHKDTKFALINGHASRFFGGAHDALFDCALERQAREQNWRTDANCAFSESKKNKITEAPSPPAGEAIMQSILEQPPCSHLTDVFPVTCRESAGAGIICAPIHAKNGPCTAVGLIATTVFWDDTLVKLAPCMHL